MKKLWLFVFLIAYVNLSAQPEVIWTKTYGGEFMDGGNSFSVTPDGGLILCGYSFSSGEGNSDAYAIKTDIDGNKIWEKTFGTERFEYGNAIINTNDNGFLIAGYTSSGGSKDFYIVKIDDSGSELWSKIFGGPKLDLATCALQAKDGSFVIGGYTENDTAGQDDIYVIKIDDQGNLIWEKKFGDKSSETCSSLLENENGDLMIFGSTGSYGATNRDYFLVKTDPDGNLIWKKNYNRNNFDTGNCIIPTADDNYLLVGSSDSHGSDFMDATTVKIDNSGTKKWIKAFSNAGFYDYGLSACMDTENNIIICANTKVAATMNNDIYLIKTDQDGAEKWTKTIDISDADWANKIIFYNGNIFLLGYTKQAGSNSFDLLLIKLYDPLTSVENNEPAATGFRLFQNYPNPFNMQTEIEFTLPAASHTNITVYDVNGKTVRSLVDDLKPAGYNSVFWDGLNDQREVISSGVYFYTMKCENFTQSRKMILIK